MVDKASQLLCSFKLTPFQSRTLALIEQHKTLTFMAPLRVTQRTWSILYLFQLAVSNTSCQIYVNEP